MICPNCFYEVDTVACGVSGRHWRCPGCGTSGVDDVPQPQPQPAEPQANIRSPCLHAVTEMGMDDSGQYRCLACWRETEHGAADTSGTRPTESQGDITSESWINYGTGQSPTPFTQPGGVSDAAVMALAEDIEVWTHECDSGRQQRIRDLMPICSRHLTAAIRDQVEQRDRLRERLCDQLVAARAAHEETKARLEEETRRADSHFHDLQVETHDAEGLHDAYTRMKAERDALAKLNKDACAFEDQLMTLLGIGPRTDDYDASDGERILEAVRALRRAVDKARPFVEGVIYDDHWTAKAQDDAKAWIAENPKETP